MDVAKFKTFKNSTVLVKALLFLITWTYISFTDWQQFDIHFFAA